MRLRCAFAFFIPRLPSRGITHIGEGPAATRLKKIKITSYGNGNIRCSGVRVGSTPAAHLNQLRVSIADNGRLLVIVKWRSSANGGHRGNIGQRSERIQNEYRRFYSYIRWTTTNRQPRSLRRSGPGCNLQDKVIWKKRTPSLAFKFPLVP